MCSVTDMARKSLLESFSRRQTYQELFFYSLVPVFTLFYWRGTWILIDSYLFPSNRHLSGWSSLCLGYLGLFLFFLTQYYGLTGHLYNDLFLSYPNYQSLLFILLRIESYFLGFFVVNSWRGLWILQDLYIIPSQPVLSSFLSHVIGVIMLYLLQHFKSVYAPPLVYFHDQEYSSIRLNYWNQDEARIHITPDTHHPPHHQNENQKNENQKNDLEAGYQDDCEGGGGEDGDGKGDEMMLREGGSRNVWKVAKKGRE